MQYLKWLLLLIFLPLAASPRAAPGDVTLPLCSQAKHAEYVRLGPDGQSYATWHPQIDPSGCHFDHEHGSDPALFSPGLSWDAASFAPLYGYTASKHGMTEGHAGFKGYALRVNDNDWYILHHFGTGNAALAACTRFHTVDVAVAHNGVLLADVHLMADFGPSVENSSGDYLTPPLCPTQGADASSSNGVRQLPTIDGGNIGYEPWRMDRHSLLFGFNSGGLVFNTPNAQTACNTISCTVNVARTDLGGIARGADRFLTSNNDGLHIWTTAAYSNTFYTDPTGTEARLATNADAVKQYIASGVDVTFLAANCRAYNAQAYWYDCSGAVYDEYPFRLNPLITGAN